MASTTATRRPSPARTEPAPPHRTDSSGPERITVALISKVSSQLKTLMEATGLSKTDVVNRAISLYEFVQKESDAGRELAVYDPQTKTYQRVHLV